MEIFLRLENFLFRPFALGDVVDHTQIIQLRSIIIADAGNNNVSPADFASFTEISLFGYIEWNFSEFQFLNILDVLTNIVRVGYVEERHRDEFISRVTHHTA